MAGRAGLLIRQAREAQGLSLDTLAATIKVPVAKLEALEADDRTVLSNPNFARALAMTVCRSLKIDPAPVLALMPAAVAVPLGSSKPPLNQPFRDFSHTGLTFEDSSSLSLRVPKLSSAVLAPLVLLILAGGIYLLPEHLEAPAWFHLSSSSPSAAPSASAPAPVAVEASGVEMGSPMIVAVADAASEAVSQAAVPASGASSVSPAPVVADAPSAAAIKPTASSVPAAVRASEIAPAASAAAPTVPSVTSVTSGASTPSGPVATLTLSSKEPAWIEVRDVTGQRVFSRQLAAGERVDVQGQAPLKVHAGNAPSVSIQFNGRPVDLAAVTHQNVARIELK